MMHVNKSDFYSLLSNLYGLTGISYYVCDRQGKLLRKNISEDYELDPYEENLFQRICSELDTCPVTKTTFRADIPVYYYACSSADTVYIIGPVAHGALDYNSMRSYRKLSTHSSGDLSYCTINTALSALSILLSVYCDTELSANELRSQFSDTSTPVNSITPLKEELQQIDSFQLNHGYSIEKQFVELLKKGDVEQMEKKWSEYPQLFPSPVPDEHRNLEYMGVTLLAVASRAAMEGGVPSHDGYLQSDVFLNKIYNCKTIDELYLLGREIVMTYTRMVHQYHLQAAQNFLILKCTKLIHSKLLEPISLSSLARELSVSESHLARCFKAEKGETVTQYILKKKIELACEILTNFDYSVNEVASYLQFHSTSYFIKVFKRHMDCTPTEYVRKMVSGQTT